MQGAKNGWYDGTAIGVAVILVISVTGNVHLFLHSIVLTVNLEQLCDYLELSIISFVGS